MKKVIGAVLVMVCLFALGSDTNADCTGTIFSDVNEASVGAQFCDYIERFSVLGITTGYGDGTYRPGNSVTRGQMAAFVMRTIELLHPALNQNFEAFASGSLTYYGPPGCESSDSGCIVTTEGTVAGTVVRDGTFTYTATILWLSGFPNGGGGFCAPASGSLILTASDLSTLTVQSVGTLCEVGASGSGKYTFNGSYLITAGTGTFAGATGTGIQICSLDGISGDALGFVHGIFKINK